MRTLQHSGLMSVSMLGFFYLVQTKTNGQTKRFTEVKINNKQEMRQEKNYENSEIKRPNKDVQQVAKLR